MQGLPAGAAAEAPAEAGGVGDRAAVTLTDGAGPELWLAKATAHVRPEEKQVAYELTVGIIGQILPDEYHAAVEVARGHREFTKDFRRCFGIVARAHPHVCGRIDGSRFAELAWAHAKMLVEATYAAMFGRRMPAGKTMAKKIIRTWERRFKPRPELPAPDKVKVKIENMDSTSITGDEFISSGNVREGTLHEIAEDLIDEEQRNFSHRRIDEIVEEGRD